MRFEAGYRAHISSARKLGLFEKARNLTLILAFTFSGKVDLLTENTAPLR